MGDNPLKALRQYGQSIWLDNIRRDLMSSGELKRLIDEDGIRGLTSNPTLFEKAIGGSKDYDEQLLALRAKGKGTMESLEELTIQDIQMAADLFQAVYESSEGEDGFISLEVSPVLANKEEQTVEAVLDLFGRVARKNVMIKVPATKAGIRALRRLTAMGISINMTLIFSLECYEAVAKAYIEGLQQLDDNMVPMGSVRSVASVFVSRVDTLVDGLLAEQIQLCDDPLKKAEIESLVGKIAIANAKTIYQKFKTCFQSPDFLALQHRGAHLQRPLWGSTGTKDPNYSDVLYIEELIGKDTVNTVPPATLDAFRDHGKPRASSIEENSEEAVQRLKRLADFGIDLKAITKALQDAGVEAFALSYRKLIDAIVEKRGRLLAKHRMHAS